MIRPIAQTFTGMSFIPKPQKEKKPHWRGQLIGYCFSFDKLDHALGFKEGEFEKLLAEEYASLRKPAVTA